MWLSCAAPAAEDKPVRRSSSASPLRYTDRGRSKRQRTPSWPAHESDAVGHVNGWSSHRVASNPTPFSQGSTVNFGQWRSQRSSLDA